MSAAPSGSSSPGALVSARGVRVTLGGSEILRGIDLDVRAGEVVALLGANGSGKSTLVRSLVGIVPLAEGSVELFGEPLGPRVPWPRLGYVPQRVAAPSGMPSTASEVVASGLLSRTRLRLPRDWRVRSEAALELVGLADRAGSTTSELSGGQQQRVLIARALVREPDLLVLDEPVAGVDAPSQDAFAATMARLVGSGLTVLVVLHELGALAPLVERAVVLRHGRVVHDGAPPRPSASHASASHQHLHPHQPDEVATGPSLGLEDTLYPDRTAGHGSRTDS
ncbi:metal ABC transporter ATP-binding protein [Cellulosimicrobium terreum]|nr:metal ABC transporter ATP-binding protein [Cellulosimicrobium terreum]